MVWVVADTSSNRGPSRRALWRYDANGNLSAEYPHIFSGNRLAIDSANNV
jgi:hypothetical protein